MAFLITPIVALTFSSLCSAGLVSLSGSDQQSAIDTHNKYRIEAGATAMQKVKWNDALAQFAATTAAQCNFEHTSYQSRSNVAGFSYIGENIYTITGAAVDQPTLKVAIDDWATEQAQYDLNSNTCSGVCGHYTQIVWASTTDVGCAIAQCASVQGFNGDAGYLIFCNYGVGGNIVGESPYERASSGSQVGSKCGERFNEAVDGNGLCVNGTGSGSTDGTSTTTTAAPPSTTSTVTTPGPTTTVTTQGPTISTLITQAPNGESTTQGPTTTIAGSGDNCTRDWDCNFSCLEDDWLQAAYNGWVNCQWDCDWMWNCQ